MALENYCDGAVLDETIKETFGQCDHCPTITSNWWRMRGTGETGRECDYCLEAIERGWPCGWHLMDE